MHQFIRKVRQKARKLNKHIVLPEGSEHRTLQAAEEIMKERLARLTLLGNPRVIKAQAKKLKLKINWKEINIVDPKTSKLRKKYINEFYELRKNKGMTKRLSEKTLQDINYFGVMMVQMDDVDGMVTGTACPTADSVRPSLQIIKTKELFHKVSGVFFLILKDRLLLCADAAITIDPNSHDLAGIAIDSAQTAKRFGIKPKVALLSFSTKGKSDHPFLEKVREAVSLIKYEKPDLIVDGEMQVDAALVPSVAKIKCPTSPIQGDANVLIFPDLQSANIAYKLIERLAKAKAVGPLLQGLKKPINDLSRGCTYKDIVNVIAFTACECENN